MHTAGKNNGTDSCFELLESRNLVLTGFMATGKTAVGRILARRLRRRLIDTDALVEEELGQTVAQIFAERGESFFREQESRVIAGLQRFPSGTLVVATGGGAVLLEDNRRALEQNGIIVLLTASPRAIIRRVKSQGGRPLLQEQNLADKINRLLRERESAYRDNRFTVDTTGKRPAQVATEILNFFSTRFNE